MLSQEAHLSDQELLLAVDGELSAAEEVRVHAHLASCWACRTRQQEVEAAIGEFIRTHRRSFDTQIPPPDGPRALLKLQLAQLAATQRKSWTRWLRPTSWRFSWAILASTLAFGIIGYSIFHLWAVRQTERVLAVTVPDPRLTPGATVLVSQRELCSESRTNNKAVSAALQRRVFDEYGIQTATPTTYEVDYLITPALGGADDIHNLWPQSSGGTVWNSQVKDALENRLRDLVCDGQIDLASAQREIATNWIEAYKKHFHTERPLNSFP